MKTLSGLLSLIISAGIGFAACNESEFGSSTSTKSTPAGTSTPTSTATEESPTPDATDDAPTADGDDGDCVEGDFINYKYSGPIQKCIDDGKMWNFDLDQCTNMPKASYECSFDGFIARLAELGLGTTKLLQEAQAGQPRKALILGCGESADNDTVLIQWFFIPEGKTVGCNFNKDQGLIITGCYGKDSGPADVSAEEKKKIVLNCMNGISAQP